MIGILTRILIALAVLASCNRDRADETPSPPSPKPPPQVLPRADAAVDASPGLPPTTERDQIAVGFAYACLHTADDKLACWGGTYPSKPTVIAGIDHVAGVVTGQSTTCAWTTKGEVYCVAGGAPKRIAGLSEVVELATDPDHFTTCARRRSGRVACWSDFDKDGPAGDDDRVTGALAIAVAGTTACMRDATGVACWSTVDPKAKLHRIAAAVGTTRLAGGGFKFVALRGDRPAVGWDEQTYKPFTLPKLPADVTQIALASKTGCALGVVVQCWWLDDPKSLHAIANVDHALEIAIGFDLGCARIEHHLSCWGTIGSLGDGTPITTDAPFTVANLDDATKLAGDADSERTCARRAKGPPVCWGARQDGGIDPLPTDASKEHLFEQGANTPRSWSGHYQRGSWTCTKAKHVTCTMTYSGRGETSSEPETRFGNLDDARDLRMPSNSSEHMCVVSGAGVVSCFQAFDGADGAVTVDDLTDVLQLAPFGAQTCALERSGKVRCWEESTRRSDMKIGTIAGITDAAEIAGGSLTACARHKTGKVSCWGSRAHLGDNADIHQRAAMIVAGVSTP